MRLLSYNIRYGGTGRESKIASVIRNCEPDIVILQEATDPEAVGRIAAAAEMEHWGSKRGNSVGFISRTAPSSFEWRQLAGVRRPFLLLTPDGADSLIIGVHLSAIHSNWTERRRLRELNALLTSIKDQRDKFHVITGDFNTLAPGELLEMSRLPTRLRLLAMMLGGRVRFRTIQAMLDAGYADCYRRFHSDEGYTFPTWDPHVRLDYYFVPSADLGRVQSCKVVREDAAISDASDHFPLMAEIEI